MYLFLYIIDWVVFLESIYIVIRGISYFIFKSKILLIVNRKRDFKFFYICFFYMNLIRDEWVILFS